VDKASPSHRASVSSGRQGRTDTELSPRPLGRGLAIGISLTALVIVAILVGAVVFGTHALLSKVPTASAPTATPAQATLPASDLPTGSPANVLAPVAACTAIPSGKVPNQITIASSGSGISADPAAAGYSNPDISVRLTGTVRTGTPAFSLIVVILPFDTTAPAASSPADSAGTIQLIAHWDGSHWHGALRSWSGSAWALSVDAGSGVDVVQNGATITLFWQGLVSGDKYGVIVASSSGCAALGLDSGLTPEQTYGSQPTA
jgi:hypothetical protein